MKRMVKTVGSACENMKKIARKTGKMDYIALISSHDSFWKARSFFKLNKQNVTPTISTSAIGYSPIKYKWT